MLSLILACDNGSVSDSGSDGLVKVSLAVDGETSVSQKAISVDSPSFTFWYKAAPQWSQDRPIHGGTNGQFVMIPNYTVGDAPKNLGYFTAGEWVFYIEVRNGSTPVYQGHTSVTISSSAASVTVNVAKIIDHATPGVVSINITAPTVRTTGDGVETFPDELTVSWSGTTAGGPVSGSDTATATPAGSITTFTYTKTELAVGTYTFTFTHNNIASGTSIAVDLNQNQMVVISGSFDSGEWDLESLIFQIHEIEIIKHNYGTEQDPVYYGEVYQHYNYAVNGDTVSFSVEPAQDSTLYEVPTVTCGGNPVACTAAGNHMYTFTMPDGDVTVHVQFTVTDTDIDPELFMFYLHSIYTANEENVQAFGRSDNPPGPGVEHVKTIRNMKMWFDGTDKICWYSSINTNRARFKSGSLANLFRGRDKYLNISLKGLDTSKITDMSHMFDSCVYLQSIDFEGVSTASVKDMSYMFYKAGYNYFPNYTTGTGAENNKAENERLNNSNNLSITNAVFTTNNVKNMQGMFHICSAIDLSGINMSDWNVTGVTDMSYMFAGYSHDNNGWKYWYNKFTGFNISNWVTSSCTTFKNMFCLCNRVTEINIQNFVFTNVQYIDRMFERCESLGRGPNYDESYDNKIVFPNHCNMKNIQDMLYMFGKCFQLRRENLATIVSSWDFENNTTIDAVFAQTSGNEAVPSNRILSREVIENKADHVRVNFKTDSPIELTTYDNRTLYIGGNSNAERNQRLRSTP